MYDQSQYIEHYGVPGMKWGVRRYQPYPKGKDGHFIGERQNEKRKLTTTEKWKDTQKAKIDKMYDKTYRRLDKAQQEDPNDKSIAEYRKTIEKQHAKDLTAIDKMTFAEVDKARNDERLAAKEARNKAIARAGGAAMWTARMALIGTRIAGFAVLANVLSDAGQSFIDYLGSEQGQMMINNGVSIISNIGNAEIFGVRLFQSKVKDIAPESALSKAVSSIDTRGMLPGENYISPDRMATSMKSVADAVDSVDRIVEKFT